MESQYFLNDRIISQCMHPFRFSDLILHNLDLRNKSLSMAIKGPLTLYFMQDPSDFFVGDTLLKWRLKAAVRTQIVKSNSQPCDSNITQGKWNMSMYWVTQALSVLLLEVHYKQCMPLCHLAFNVNVTQARSDRVFPPLYWQDHYDWMELVHWVIFF